MNHVSQREVLQDLAQMPLGSPELQAEADRIKGSENKGSPELQETKKRCAKKWLPQGKRTVSRADTVAAERAFYANQTDIEDAVEAAGGQRGGLRPA